MKNLFKLMFLSAFLLCFTACSDEEDTTEKSLAVTPANLNGVWQLATWNNGEALPEGTYCYVVFNRREQTFEMYQKFDSMYARYITGSFKIENDPYLGYVISGEYDYGNGEWNHEYIVTDLLSSGSMVWTAADDAGDVSKYVRCDEVPDEIVEESKKEEN